MFFRRAPWEILRAVFYLFGAIVLMQAFWVTVSALACIYMIVTKSAEIGACASLTDRAREVFSEMLTGILALLAAGRGGPPIIQPRAEAPPDERVR